MGDDPTEQIQEDIHHHATHGDEHAEGHEGGHGGGHGGHHGPRWITMAALTAALLAALAAISASLATTHLTDSTLIRIQANDQWNYYQAKSIKSSVTDTRMMNYAVLLDQAGGDAAKLPKEVVAQHKDDLSKKAEYNLPAEKEKDPDNPKGMKGIQELAARLQDASEAHLSTHETFEMSETLFHISIAVVAIAVVAKRKEFWYMSMVGGVIGLWFFGGAMAKAPHEAAKKPEAAAVAPANPGGPEKKAGEEKTAPEEHKDAGGSVEHAG